VKQDLLFWLATRLGWLLVLMWGRATRIEVLHQHHLDRLLSKEQPFILCIWHGRILLPIYLHRTTGLHAMVSTHRDGEMIARVLQKLGYRTVRGSSTRGGREAFHRMVNVLRNGGKGAIMPDGPRGPRHHFKPGAIKIAQRSGALLLPLTFAAERNITLKSWDRFLLWRPFSRTVAMYGQPIAVPARLDGEQLENLRHGVERQMIELELQADAHFQP
jgi:lysophospholipid acyltransferase (LPLAT)-like uncharacterized protein